MTKAFRKSGLAEVADPEGLVETAFCLLEADCYMQGNKLELTEEYVEAKILFKECKNPPPEVLAAQMIATLAEEHDAARIASKFSPRVAFLVQAFAEAMEVRSRAEDEAVLRAADPQVRLMAVAASVQYLETTLRLHQGIPLDRPVPAAGGEMLPLRALLSRRLNAAGALAAVLEDTPTGEDLLEKRFRDACAAMSRRLDAVPGLSASGSLARVAVRGAGRSMLN